MQNNDQVNTHKRNTSFSKSPSLAQLVSWILFLLMILSFYIYIRNEYESLTLKITMTTIFTLSMVSLMFFALYTGQTDPTDEIVIEQRCKQMEKVIEYRNSGNRLFYCSICQATVKQKSRHCRVCENCSQNFDHHCIWLNVCIGGKNYRQFIFTIILTFTTFIIYLLTVCLLTQQKLIHEQFLGSFGFIASWIIAVFVIVFLFLIINLIILHIYLIYKGLSTYEFILLRAEQQKKEKEQSHQNFQKNKNIDKQKIQTQQILSQKMPTFQKIVPQSKPIETDNDGTEPELSEKEEINLKGQMLIKRLSNAGSKKSMREIQPGYAKGHQQSDIGFGEFKMQKKQFNKISLNQTHHLSETDRIKSEKQLNLKKIMGQSEHSESGSAFKQKYLIQTKYEEKSRLNRYFINNFSLSLILPAKQQEIEPSQNIIKNIQLDYQIQKYKSNLSLNLQTKISNKKSLRNFNYFNQLFTNAQNSKRKVHSTAYDKKINQNEDGIYQKKQFSVQQQKIANSVSQLRQKQIKNKLQQITTAQ